VRSVAEERLRSIGMILVICAYCGAAHVTRFLLIKRAMFLDVADAELCRRILQKIGME
jgi:hypothetical protein